MNDFLKTSAKQNEALAWFSFNDKDKYKRPRKGARNKEQNVSGFNGQKRARLVSPVSLYSKLKQKTVAYFDTRKFGFFVLWRVSFR